MDALPWVWCPLLCTYVTINSEYTPCACEETATDMCALPLRRPFMQIDRFRHRATLHRTAHRMWCWHFAIEPREKDMKRDNLKHKHWINIVSKSVWWILSDNKYIFLISLLFLHFSISFFNSSFAFMGFMYIYAIVSFMCIRGRVERFSGWAHQQIEHVVLSATWCSNRSWCSSCRSRCSSVDRFFSLFWLFCVILYSFSSAADGFISNCGRDINKLKNWKIALNFLSPVWLMQYVVCSAVANCVKCMWGVALQGLYCFDR